MAMTHPRTHRRTRRWTRTAAALAGAALVATALVGQAEASPGAAPGSPGRPGWVSSWHTAVQPASAGSPALAGVTDTTYRLRVHTSAGGPAARVRLSNVYSKAPLVVDAVTVAVPAAASGAAVKPGTLRKVTFRGSAGTTVPAGAEVVSDPVAAAVPADADFFVSIHLPGPTGPLTWHSLAVETSRTASGNHTGDTAASAFTTETGSWFVLSGLEVAASRGPEGATGTVVTYGDSITEGYQSTWDADVRWPDLLADRLAARPGPRRLAVANSSISGNQVLLDTDPFGQNAVARVDRDVLAVPGARSVVILLGINDIQLGGQTDASLIIAGLEQIAQRARDRGLVVVGGTLCPFKGWNPWSPELEATRQAVNGWIRTSPVFDSLVDFDRATRDPADPQRLLPAYDSGDHLHPNDAGYARMAAAVDLRDLG